MRGGSWRAPCNASSRGASGGAELFVACAADAVKDALRAVHHDVVGDALRVEGHEGARGGAQLVVGRVDSSDRRIAMIDNW